MNEIETLSWLLTETRQAFMRLFESEQAIKGVLKHEATNAKAEGAVLPGLEMRGLTARMKIAERRDFQRRDADGHALFIQDGPPVLDPSGNPITNSAGLAYDIVMPASRDLHVYGEGRAVVKLREWASRGGALLRSMPKALPSSMQGWNSWSDEGLWWNLVFELAWSGQYPTLKAERHIGFAGPTPMSMEYDLNLAASLLKRKVKIGKPPAHWAKRLPDAYTSMLANLAMASADATAAIRERAENPWERVHRPLTDDEVQWGLRSAEIVARVKNEFEAVASSRDWASAIRLHAQLVREIGAPLLLKREAKPSKASVAAFTRYAPNLFEHGQWLWRSVQAIRASRVELLRDCPTLAAIEPAGNDIFTIIRNGDSIRLIDEANRLAVLVEAEQIPPDGSSMKPTPAKPGKGRKQKKRGGSKPKYDAKWDDELLKQRQAIQSQRRLTIKEFASEIGLPYLKVKQALDRARKRN